MSQFQTVPASSGADGGGPHIWATPNNITVDDNTMATAATNFLVVPGNLSNDLLGTFAGFSIPPSAILQGIVFTQRRISDTLNAIFDFAVIMTIGGVPIGDDKPNGNPWDTTAEVITYGGASDLWNSGVTIADLNAGIVGIDFVSHDPAIGGANFAVNGWFLTAYYLATTSGIFSATDA